MYMTRKWKARPFERRKGSSKIVMTVRDNNGASY